MNSSRIRTILSRIYRIDSSDGDVQRRGRALLGVLLATLVSVVLVASAFLFAPLQRKTPTLIVIAVITLVCLVGAAITRRGRVDAGGLLLSGSLSLLIGAYILHAGVYTPFLWYTSLSVVLASISVRPRLIWVSLTGNIAVAVLVGIVLPVPVEERMRVTSLLVALLLPIGVFSYFSAARSRAIIQAQAAAMHELKDAKKKLDVTLVELVAHRNALEERVAERTADLEVKNERLEVTIAELKLAQAQLVQCEKMASLGLLVAGIAHELKNPLNFVNNFSELAIEFIDELAERRTAEEPADAAEIEATLADVADNLRRVREHGRRADGIINAMLMHSRERHGEPTAVDFNAMLLEHVNLAYHGFRASEGGFAMELVKELDPSISELMLPHQEVARVVVNLVSNACHAMRERQQRDPEYKATLTLRTTLRSGEVEFVIKDNGIGMTPDVRRRIFDPFYTTRPPGEGTGLGLSLSYEVIVKELGGSIDVQSMPSEGAEFVVRIPVPATTAAGE